ncbi:hypothetical protein CAPTEDRAFT_185678 [Capitella teleta]|uniref:G-protein coupled receptors family 1 profile domain-containing protein n=1 Tax=Capitella teleta TaxID=283909 RepID=R7VIJ2_CAPTE|nr:hypothetical protein CAPTEDRAFT_185678 [Capitella teleta]|eukprot:ELU18362.1 hypothetical protein CAPTEDRAFT_185678 [Capitella teleta]
MSTSSYDFSTELAATTAKLSSAAKHEEGKETSIWWSVFDYIQVTLTIAGFLANILTLVTLVKSARRFSRLIKILLQHQSLVDACVCACATALILQPSMWLPGNAFGDHFVCYIWHGQAAYWGLVTLSTYNLVLIALERYLAICRPFAHTRCSDYSRKKLATYGAWLYVFCLFLTHGTYIQTRLTDGQCKSEYAFDGKWTKLYFTSFVIFTYITTYLIPALTMALLYSLVAHQLRKRKENTELGKSKTIDRATDQLTKTAVTVTIIFILSVGYDLHFYLLGYNHVIEYTFGSPEQKVGVFLSNLNSVANPLVYALLMPIYRKCVVETICPRRAKSEDADQASKSTSLRDLSNSVSNIA